MGKLLALVLVLSVAAVGCSAADGVPDPGRTGQARATAADSPSAVVDVSVATLWKKPRLLRPPDAPSAQNPVHIRSWLAGMTTDQRLWLVGKLQTQATYGTEVTVLAQSGKWTKVAVHGQPTPLNAEGYPGWLPTRQLTTSLAVPDMLAKGSVAIVTQKTAWLRSAETHERRIEVSFGTRLAVVGESGPFDLVAKPAGGRVAVAKDSVAEYPSVGAIPAPSGRRIVATSKRFLGLPYLWAGTSGFGFDCSGFTYLVYRRFGIGMPRDADRQALHGTPVARKDLKLGDLVFFAGSDGTIHHVGIYAGNGTMIESPRTGEAVRIAPLRSGYAGARRYL
jgi:gamma-D-glutamyl-L-lysine dipeptidyl-peptidase